MVLARTILVTRPEEAANEMASELKAIGRTPILAPLTKIIRLHTKTPVFKEYGVVLATSTNAITQAPFGLQGIERFICVGAKTGMVGLKNGLPKPIYVAEDSKALIARLDIQLKDKQPILYLAGRERRPEIEWAMDDRNMTYAVCETYSAPAVVNPLRDVNLRTINGVTLCSVRAAELFAEAVEAKGLAFQLREMNCAFYCMSYAVAEALYNKFPYLNTRIKYSHKPNMGSLMKLLLRG